MHRARGRGPDDAAGSWGCWRCRRHPPGEGFRSGDERRPSRRAHRFPGMAMIGPEFPVVLGAAARGDEEAFGRLWRDLQPRLLRYFAVVSPAAAEDLASETWLGMVRGIDRFEGNESAHHGPVPASPPGGAAGLHRGGLPGSRRGVSTSRARARDRPPARTWRGSA